MTPMRLHLIFPATTPPLALHTLINHLANNPPRKQKIAKKDAKEAAEN